MSTTRGNSTGEVAISFRLLSKAGAEAEQAMKNFGKVAKLMKMQRVSDWRKFTERGNEHGRRTRHRKS